MTQHPLLRWLPYSLLLIGGLLLLQPSAKAYQVRGHYNKSIYDKCLEQKVPPLTQRDIEIYTELASIDKGAKNKMPLKYPHPNTQHYLEIAYKMDFLHLQCITHKIFIGIYEIDLLGPIPVRPKEKEIYQRFYNRLHPAMRPSDAEVQLIRKNKAKLEPLIPTIDSR